jgi:hypothetical protein
LIVEAFDAKLTRTLATLATLREVTMIDSTREDLYPLSVHAREIRGRNGAKGVSCSTVFRWTLRGIRGVKLESQLVGGIRMTSREALARFFAAATAAAGPQTLHSVTSRRKAKKIDDAERQVAEFRL